ncbi:MAG TPA: hypothetical protein VFC01_35745 [Mycobacterium sp.]|nr:hypothetical protein [Mycobacterium sp.]
MKLVMNVFLIADLVFLDAHDVFARASGGPNQLIELDQDRFALRLVVCRRRKSIRRLTSAPVV